MSLRSIASGERCPRCRLSPNWCYCHQLQPVSHHTPISFIMHVSECYLPSSTANLMNQISSNCTFYVRGIQQEQHLNILPDHTPIYLYPDEDAEILTCDWLNKQTRPLQLIVPDGSWRQAKKIKKRMPELLTIPCLKLPTMPPSRYFLRKQKYPTGVSTFEAVAWALKFIESEEIFQQLTSNFNIMMKAFAKSNPYKGAQYLDTN